jgi:hypothetical protein
MVIYNKYTSCKYFLSVECKLCHSSGILYIPEAEFMNVQFRLGSGHNPRVIRLEVSLYNIYITNQFKPLLGGG